MRDHLTEAARLYGVTADALEPLGAFESDVYAFTGPAGRSILKVIAPDHRSVDQVQAEVDWLLALLEAGVSVAEPRRAVTGAWVEHLPATDHVLVAFRQAPGATTKHQDWTPELIQSWGELLGRMQACSRSWSPPGPRRHPLAEQTYLARLDELPAEDEPFRDAARKIFEAAQPLLQDGEGAGLIHADLHHGNLLLHEGEWTAIDFDDCAYGAYAFDVAMPLYYAVRGQRDLTPTAATERFLPAFMRGLRRHAPGPAGGAEAIALALRLRMAELVVALDLKLPEDQWTPEMQAVRRDLRDRTVAGTEVVPLDVLERCLAGG